MSANSSEKNISESLLVAEAKKGDRASIDALVKKYIPALFGFFKYLNAPEPIIEDLIQETFEKLFRSIDSFDEKRAFSSWLMTIGRNVFFDNCRKIKRTSPTREEKIENTFSPSPEDAIVSNDSVRGFLESLSHENRFLVELRVFYELPFAEIAKITQEHETTLRSRFCRLMTKLRMGKKIFDAER